MIWAIVTGMLCLMFWFSGYWDKNKKRGLRLMTVSLFLGMVATYLMFYFLISGL